MTSGMNANRNSPVMNNACHISLVGRSPRKARTATTTTANSINAMKKAVTPVERRSYACCASVAFTLGSPRLTNDTGVQLLTREGAIPIDAGGPRAHLRVSPLPQGQRSPAANKKRMQEAGASKAACQRVLAGARITRSTQARIPTYTFPSEVRAMDSG
jgi:hypothetical protein